MASHGRPGSDTAGKQIIIEPVIVHIVAFSGYNGSSGWNGFGVGRNHEGTME